MLIALTIKILSAAAKKNATSSWLLATRKNRVAGHSKIEEEAVERNIIACHSEIKSAMQNANGDLLDIRFFINK